VRLDSNFPDRAGDEVNGRLGLRVAATNALSIRGAFYSGFRVPTLNELYRPFRVGNDVTEANPQLLPEHLTGGEIGADLQVARTLKVSSTAFLNRMTDAVGNVTIGAGPGTFNPGGFIPAGGVLRQRQNIDLVEAPGVEMTAQWQLVRALALNASYIFTQPTVDRAGDQSLEGKLLAQTPEHVATAGFDWNPTTRWNISAQIRYSDRQFEDDQNTRVLAPFTTVDLAASYEFSAHASAAVRVENLFNEQIQTGVSATGVVSTGAPRLVTFEFRYGL
jgi:vitamin B12 transporter